MGRRGKPSGTPGRKRSRIGSPPWTTAASAGGYPSAGACASNGFGFPRRVCATIDREHRTWKRFRVALHLSSQFADLRGVCERAAFVRDDSDGQGHERDPVQLTPPILTKKVTCP